MNRNYFENGHEFEPARKISSAPPAVELLSDPGRAAEAWEKFAGDKEFLGQVEERQSLNERLDAVLSHLPRPDMPLEEAITQDHLKEDQVADMYESLNGLLEDPDYKRLVFYLPFEFLPNAAWAPASEKLRQEIKNFKDIYMSAWNNLLRTQDVRANFVDGDVLEVESRTGDLPRVVKAAHLIPKLIENGFLEMEDVFEMMETHDNEILNHSIADTLPVLADLGFLQEKDFDRIRDFENSYANEKLDLILSSKDNIEKKQPEENITLSSISKQLNEDFKNINAEELGKVTKKRKTWLKHKKKEISIKSASEKIQNAIASERLNDEEGAEFLSSEADQASQRAFLEGLRKKIEALAHEDNPQAKMLYAKYKNFLLTLWERDVPEIHDELAKTFCRLHGLDIVTDEELQSLDIVIPTLSGPFSENLKPMAEEVDEIKKIAALIESDEQLSRYIYPVVLIFGSRLKGYGDKNSDIDAGVFIKPGTSLSEMGHFKELLKKTFHHEKIEGEIVEFWLEQNGDELEVQDLGSPSPSMGESSWTHVLFGAAWEGDERTINELREKLLAPYFYDDKKEAFGRAARKTWLEELERDTLQYRLMHKGYEKFHPSYGGMNTPHADQIDGQSVFWDSGYRQTATKLFAQRVFLPKVSRPEK